MDSKEFIAGTGAHSVEAMAVVTEGGLSVTLCTAKHSHIGATAQAIPRPEQNRTATVSILSVPYHRDDVCAHELAAMLATRLRVTVVVSVGMHIDDASTNDIQLLLNNARSIGIKIAEWAESIF